MYCVFQYTQRQIDQQMYIFPCCKNYGKCIFFFFFFLGESNFWCLLEIRFLLTLAMLHVFILLNLHPLTHENLGHIKYCTVGIFLHFSAMFVMTFPSRSVVKRSCGLAA